MSISHRRGSVYAREPVQPAGAGRRPARCSLLTGKAQRSFFSGGGLLPSVLVLSWLFGLLTTHLSHAQPAKRNGPVPKIEALFEKYHQRNISLSELFDHLNEMNADAVQSAAGELLTADYRTLKPVLSRDNLKENALSTLRSRLRNKRSRLLSVVRNEKLYGRSSSPSRRKKITRSALALFTLYRKPLVYYMETHDRAGTAFFRAVALIKYFRGHRREPPPPSQRILDRIDRARNTLTTKRVTREPEESDHSRENRQVQKMNQKRNDALSGTERKLVDLVNAYREMFGLRTLIIDDQVTDAARVHARQMKKKGRMTHRSAKPRRKPVLTRLEKQGFRARKAGENVAKGDVSPMAVLKGWIESPSHHRNLLVASYRYIGVAREGKFWTLNLATVPRTRGRK